MGEAQRYLTKSLESLDGAESEYGAARPNNVASLAYYAAFQAAVAALIDAGLSIRRTKGEVLSHQAVHALFSGILISRRKQYPTGLRNVLQVLLRERIIADYKPSGVSLIRAKRVLEKARIFVDSIHQRIGE